MEVEVLEYVLIGAIIILQGYLAYQAYQRIKILRNLFQFKEGPEVKSHDIPISFVNAGDLYRIFLFIEGDSREEIPANEETIDLSLVSAISLNDIDIKILHNVNNYLLKNKGAVADYHLLKDIVIREVDTLDEEINNALPAPLYLGLAATMVGIIFGLISIPSFSGAAFDVSLLNPLLDGVKIAMTASVIGLALTTYLTVVEYKKAKATSEGNKNKFLSFLQANLLPELIRTETSGITALNDRLKKFSKTLTPAISSLSGVVERSLKAVQIQQEVVSKVDQLDVNKLSKANIKIFNKIQQMMASFNQFAAYYQELNRSMAQTVELTSNLKNLVKRTNNVETIAHGIEDTFQQNKELNVFVARHFKNIGSREAALEQMVDSSERNLKDSFEQMELAVQEKITSIKNFASDMEPEIKEVFASTVSTLEQMTNDQINKIEQAFENSRPKFEKLEKLDKIDESLNTLAAQGLLNSEKQDKLIEAINTLTVTIASKASESSSPTIIGSNSNGDILAELKSINGVLSATNSRKNRNIRRLKTALTTFNTIGFIGLGTLVIYAITRGIILFW